ncbi:alpha/beta fold hydrolase [Streptomyces sp. NPDC057699]|uniref:alpha/beta fold hydrolase n=1 Tax=Streptomyces sp. NPDC057699 TaxID=3346220 RepID=UPI0036843824
MARRITLTAVTALCCVALGAGLVACEEVPEDSGSASPAPSASSPADAKAFSGTKKISVEGHSVNVSCSGDAVDGGPVVVLMTGLGDDLTKMSGFQKTVSEENRVCSFDRLGQGASDKPAGPRTVADSGKILTGVLDRVAGDRPVVLAGHSLGGLLAARYAPEHQDRIKGLVLMDATSPTTTADISKVIPASAEAPADELRAQTLAVNKGENPEMLLLPDGPVRTAGDIPVEAVQHGVRYLGEVPTYGDDLERVWTEGQHQWLGISTDSELSTAEKSAHDIYVDRPDLAVAAIRSVTARVTG